MSIGCDPLLRFMTCATPRHWARMKLRILVLVRQHAVGGGIDTQAGAIDSCPNFLEMRWYTMPKDHH